MKKTICPILVSPFYANVKNWLHVRNDNIIRCEWTWKSEFYPTLHQKNMADNINPEHKKQRMAKIMQSFKVKKDIFSKFKILLESSKSWLKIPHSMLTNDFRILMSVAAGPHEMRQFFNLRWYKSCNADLWHLIRSFN